MSDDGDVARQEDSAVEPGGDSVTASGSAPRVDTTVEPTTGAIVVTSYDTGATTDAVIIPAADRFGSIDHESPTYKEAEEALEALDSAIRGSNDLFANADERLAVSDEVQGVLGIIRGGVVRVGAVLCAIKDSGIVAYLAKECANALIREYAARALKSLWTLITILLS